MGEGLGNGCGGVRGGWRGKGRLGATGRGPFCINDIRPEKGHLAKEQGQKVRSFCLERGPAGFSGDCLWLSEPQGLLQLRPRRQRSQAV